MLPASFPPRHVASACGIATIERGKLLGRRGGVLYTDGGGQAPRVSLDETVIFHRCCVLYLSGRVRGEQYLRGPVRGVGRAATPPFRAVVACCDAQSRFGAQATVTDSPSTRSPLSPAASLPTTSPPSPLFFSLLSSLSVLLGLSLFTRVSAS